MNKVSSFVLIFKEITTTYDVSLRCVYSITSFQGFVRNQPAFRCVGLCFYHYFLLLLFVLRGRFLLVLWLAKLLLKSRMGAKTWRPMASLYSLEARHSLYTSRSVVPTLWLDSIVSPLRLRWVKVVCRFRCSHLFFEQFGSLLEHCNTLSWNSIILGDFSYHFDESNNPHTEQMTDLLTFWFRSVSDHAYSQVWSHPGLANWQAQWKSAWVYWGDLGPGIRPMLRAVTPSCCCAASTPCHHPGA